jgi:hypothetical protein
MPALPWDLARFCPLKRGEGSAGHRAPQPTDADGRRSWPLTLLTAPRVRWVSAPASAQRSGSQQPAESVLVATADRLQPPVDWSQSIAHHAATLGSESRRRAPRSDEGNQGSPGLTAAFGYATLPRPTANTRAAPRPTNWTGRDVTCLRSECSFPYSLLLRVSVRSRPFPVAPCRQPHQRRRRSFLASSRHHVRSSPPWIKPRAARSLVAS